MNLLNRVLRFATGFNDIPPLGIWPKPTLTFLHESDQMDFHEHARGLPYANTCANQLGIPVLPNYDNFKTRMCLALEVGTTFTNA